MEEKGESQREEIYTSFIIHKVNFCMSLENMSYISKKTDRLDQWIDLANVTYLSVFLKDNNQQINLCEITASIRK